jgi:hypothetical protein
VLGQATGNTNSLDSPWPGLRGGHHLPPYSILCVTPPHPRPNGFLSQDSQSGVPKLSQLALLGLCNVISFCSDLRLGRGQKQSFSSPQELSNSVSHSLCTHRGWVDSWLLMVGSQTPSLTPDLSFDHNLCYRCPNCSCEAIFEFTLWDLSNGIKNTSRRGVLAYTIEFWSFGSPGGLWVPTFGSVSFILTLVSKWGCDSLFQ